MLMAFLAAALLGAPAAVQPPGWASLDEHHNRGIDLLSPVWNLFDLLPSGRLDWEATGWWGFLKK